MEYSIRTLLIVVLVVIAVLILVGLIVSWFTGGDNLVWGLFDWIKQSTDSSSLPWND